MNNPREKRKKAFRPNLWGKKLVAVMMMALALMNAARNTGGSIGVSLASNVLAHREQFHQSVLTGDAIPSGIAYQDTFHQVTQYFVAQGSSLVQAHQQAIA